MNVDFIHLHPAEDRRAVYVVGAAIPAMSTVARCIGVDVGTDEVVEFAADHRAARRMGRLLRDHETVEGWRPPVTVLEGWQVLRVSPPSPTFADLPRYA